MDLYSLLLTLGLANVLIAFLSATVSRSWIPWLIALLWKKPISRKFVAGLSVFFRPVRLWVYVCAAAG